MKRSLFFILLLVLPLSYSGTLLIGTTPQNPPFNSIADTKDHYYGFDIDISGEICKRLQIKCRFSATQFDDLFTALKTGKIDLVSAAIIITPDRQEEFLFSLPYLASTAKFMTTQPSPINSPADLEHKKIGVRLGTPFKKLAISIYNDQIAILEFANNANLLDALNNKTVDAVLMDTAAVKSWVANNSNSFKSVGSIIPIGQGYAFMANRDQAKLIEQINQALLSMEKDGSYLKIYDNYFTD